MGERAREMRQNRELARNKFLKINAASLGYIWGNQRVEKSGDLKIWH